jgi:hypothetical protein
MPRPFELLAFIACKGKPPAWPDRGPAPAERTLGFLPWAIAALAVVLMAVKVPSWQAFCLGAVVAALAGVIGRFLFPEGLTLPQMGFGMRHASVRWQHCSHAKPFHLFQTERRIYMRDSLLRRREGACCDVEAPFMAGVALGDSHTGAPCARPTHGARRGLAQFDCAQSAATEGHAMRATRGR